MKLLIMNFFIISLTIKKSNAIFILLVNFECYVVITSSMATQASDLEDQEYDPNIADNISSELVSEEIDEDVVKRPPPSTVEIKSLESGKKWYDSLILSYFCFEDKKLAPPKSNENIKGSQVAHIPETDSVTALFLNV
jgi:hypothetical protein